MVGKSELQKYCRGCLYGLITIQYPNKYYSTDIGLRNAYRLCRKNKRDCSADVKGLLLQPLF